MSAERAVATTAGPGTRDTVVLGMVRAHVRRRYAPGEVLGPLSGIARDLLLQQNAVRRALRRLDTLGEIAICGPSTRVVLEPGQMHPHDLPLARAVRARILAGRYRSGQALATGLLGDEFALSPAHVRRACAHLLAEGLLRQDEAGPFGPAYYVT
ncbi:GntR family transcriptional regulator [Streptomyces sp. NPDC006487]|uniref:GntR family transcriptional regulator n=1 Tax=Streptomyces sp. NPDC006487 TaxID=3364748 RepID=UPI00368C4C79